MGRKHYEWLVRKAQDREKWRQFIAAYLQQVDRTSEEEEEDSMLSIRVFFFFFENSRKNFTKTEHYRDF